MGAEDRLRDIVDVEERQPQSGRFVDVSLPTGRELFEAMSPAEQDAEFGQAAAEALRTGEITLSDLVQKSPLETSKDFITQRPLKDAI